MLSGTQGQATPSFQKKPAGRPAAAVEINNKNIPYLQPSNFSMASPPSPALSPTPENGKSSKLTYYYFAFGLTLVAIVLLFTNGVFLGCFSWIRRFWATRGLGRDLSEEEMRQWIPAFRNTERRIHSVGLKTEADSHFSWTQALHPSAREV
ncbi:hypothetical protein KSP40_PGU006247 [Platanthera guangdongensis]|uniref:ATP synthase F0 subunit 8 n=1 Tax=Platanthera guangdongensis TaxID=2320717 RepID=A0ABR2LWV1_9ASPA